MYVTPPVASYQPALPATGVSATPEELPSQVSVALEADSADGGCWRSSLRSPKNSCAVVTLAGVNGARDGDARTAAAMIFRLSSCWMTLHPESRATARAATVVWKRMARP